MTAVDPGDRSPRPPTGPETDDDVVRRWRWLALFAVAYGVLHHQGFVLARLGDVGTTGTRWADWIDVATPYAVVLPATLALGLGDRARIRDGGRKRIGMLLLFVVGAVTYVEGHGIHLSANSIGNAGAGATARVDEVVHLWDELVGHYLWYGGFSLMVIALGVTFAGFERPEGRFVSPAAVGLAVLVGVTYATNALEGNFAVPALLFSAAMVAWTVGRHFTARSQSAKASGGGADVVGLTFGPAVFLLGFYGIWHRGFPDPTSVGWNVLAP